MTYLIYLLSGLLVVHGTVCLLGAFFPFYPPVYIFYVFFPGHFAIRLIIVLLVGAAQVVYGIQLALSRKWRLRWYWPALAVIVIAGLLLVFPTYPTLFGVPAEENARYQPIPVKEMHPSLAGPEAPDDIVPTPGGPAYRVGQQGVEHPWPPIDTNKVTITSSFEVDTVYVRYRDYIETEAGESRNNIVFISMGNRAVGSLELSTVNMPTGIEVTEGMRWYGPGPVSVVLVIETSPDMDKREYSFGLAVKIDGKMYGVIPCTIKVLESTSASTPSEIIPKEPYPGNHGITTTKATPKPGDNIISSSSLMIKLTTDDLVEKSDAIVIGKVVDIYPARFEPEIMQSSFMTIFTDVIIEAERYLYGEPQSAYIAVRVMGGRVGEMVMWVEDQPEFNLGEEVALFLLRPQLEIAPPEGFEDAEYYMVTGSMQGKFSYKDGDMVNLEGDSFAVSEIEKKIASIHGGK